MKKKSGNLFVIFLYFLAFILMTFPLVLNFSSVMPGNGGDEYLMTWFFWEFYHSIFVLHSWPYYTHMAYYPDGVPLYITTSMPVNQFLSSILYLLTRNWILTFNLIFMLSSVLNGFFAYLLAFDATKNKPASFIAGLIFSFSPIIVEQARWGDLNIWSAYGIPMYILFFNRMFKEPGIKNALLAALGLFLATYAGFYEFTAMLLFYSAIFIIYNFVAGKTKDEPGKSLKERFLKNPALRPSYIKSLIIMVLSFVLASSLFLVPSLYYMYINPGVTHYIPSLYWTEAYSSTVSAFFIPPFFNKLLLPFTLFFYKNPFYRLTFRGANSQDFLGYVPIALFIFALVYGFKDNQKLRFYAFVFFVFVFMSLSPMIHIFNNIRVFNPFIYLIYLLPILKDVGEPGRYMITGFLFFGIITAYGIKFIFEKLRSITAVLFFSIILIGTIAGYTSYPFKAISQKIPPWVYIIKHDPGKGAVLYVPAIYYGFPMYEQTIYQKPVLGGYIIRYGFHNRYGKYLPEKFSLLKNGRHPSSGINLTQIMNLGNPKNFLKNYTYLKRLNISYIVIKNKPAGQIYGITGKKMNAYIQVFVNSKKVRAKIIYSSRNYSVIKLL